MVLILAITTGVLAQTPTPTQFSGVINDYTPSTSSPMGPWEMRGPWTLTLNQDTSKADFSATLTMELSDYTRNSVECRQYVSHDRQNAAHSPHRDRRAAQSRKFLRAGSS